ncbi:MULTISPECIES: YagK/YfjJ domain-containing protein [Stutzerimonas]|uniref:YagK/YfjJ domain-containing protein n=1 Tax=Stutzerimonas TaxID=2901164 RepID=UPI00289EB5C9|nr:inovirus-type Gp2 protein [Stutzerimonas kunmingensis]
MIFYKGYRINAGNKDQYSFDPVIMEEIYQRFTAITQQLSQCYLIRFDLHFPLNAPQMSPLEENEMISSFWRILVQRRLKRGAKRHRHLVYFWVREVEKSKRGHYHCFIIVDRHRLNSLGSIANKTGFIGLLSMIWYGITGGNVHVPSLAINGLQVRNKSERDTAFYALSYLAKTRGKYGQSAVRNFGGSRLIRHSVSKQAA